MKKFAVYFMGFMMAISLAPLGTSAHYNNTLCYNYEDSRYEECTHSHVNTNYGYSNVYSAYNYGSYPTYNYNSYYPTTRVATQTYTKPVSRYVCDYDYYYGNRCYYKTDYVKTYRQVPVTNYSNYYSNYNNYSGYSNYNYSSYPSYYSAYNYNNYNTYNSGYPYSYNYSNY